MNSIRKNDPMEKNIIKHKKMQDLQNKITGHRKNIALTKGVVPDPRKRQFIKKGILGIIAGMGIALFSKVAHAGGIKFYDDPNHIIDSARGVAKVWAQLGSDGVLKGTGYNISSTGKDSTGVYSVTIDNDFSNTDYAFMGGLGTLSAYKITLSNHQAGSYKVNAFDTEDAPVNIQNQSAAFGDL